MSLIEAMEAVMADVAIAKTSGRIPTLDNYQYPGENETVVADHFRS